MTPSPKIDWAWVYQPSTMERGEQPPAKGDGPARGAPARTRNETNKGSELEGPREVTALGNVRSKKLTWNEMWKTDTY